MTQVAVITGAAQGLGLAIAKSLLNAGYKVVLTDVNVEEVTISAKNLAIDQKNALGLKLDVLNKNDFEEVLWNVIDIYGNCSVLVNNAAMTPTTPVMEITGEEFSRVLDINLRGTLFGSQVFGEYFCSNGYGRIVNMASLAGQMGGTASGAHYAASKGGIITLTKVFARQFAGQGVTVNAIAPGPVDVASIRDKISAEKLEEIINTMIPVQAISNPDLIAAMVTMLVSKEANTVTGACWDANGGIYMR